MRITTTFAATALLAASAFGVMSIQSSRAEEASAGPILVQNAGPAPQAQTQAPTSPKASAGHHRSHKSAMHRNAHRHKASKHMKRTGEKGVQKSSRKTQRPS
jgi:hypothetical protein